MRSLTLANAFALAASFVATVSIATPGVVSKVAHGLKAGDKIQFSTTGALPTGLAAATDYFVIAAGLTADAFELAATLGGAAINTTGSQSGVHTVHALTGSSLAAETNLDNQTAPFLAGYSAVLSYKVLALANGSVHIEGASANADGTAGTYSDLITAIAATGQAMAFIKALPDFIRVRMAPTSNAGAGTAQVTLLGN